MTTHGNRIDNIREFLANSNDEYAYDANGNPVDKNTIIHFTFLKEKDDVDHDYNEYEVEYANSQDDFETNNEQELDDEQELNNEKEIDDEQELDNEKEIDDEQELDNEKKFDNEQELNNEKKFDNEQEIDDEQELNKEQELDDEQDFDNPKSPASIAMRKILIAQAKETFKNSLNVEEICDYIRDYPWPSDMKEPNFLACRFSCGLENDDFVYKQKYETILDNSRRIKEKINSNPDMSPEEISDEVASAPIDSNPVKPTDLSKDEVAKFDELSDNGKNVDSIVLNIDTVADIDNAMALILRLHESNQPAKVEKIIVDNPDQELIDAIHEKFPDVSIDTDPEVSQDDPDNELQDLASEASPDVLKDMDEISNDKEHKRRRF